MANKGIYARLNLDRDHILPDIEEYCRREYGTFDVSPLLEINKGNNHYRYKINVDSCSFCIDFYFRIDGTTTIQPNVGSCPDLAIKLAEHILSKAQYIDVQNTSYSIKLVEKDIYHTLLEYLNTLHYVDQTYSDTTGENGYLLHQYKSNYGDRITIKYFNNKTLQIQGKPMHLHQEVTCLLAEYFPFDDVVKRQQEIFSIPLDPKEIRDEINQLLPTAHKVLGDTLINILSASISFNKIDIKLPDYSSFAFPALRVLEGYLKYLFGLYGITVDREFKCFYPNGGAFKLKSDAKAKITCSKTCTAMEEIYSHLNKHRHSLFHAESVLDTTRIISNKNEARELIYDTIRLIESWHSNINNP